MDPKQNVGAAAPQSKPVASENIMAQGISAKKNSKGMILGMVFLAILAIGGIGFGVWAWMDGNAQKDSLNSKIAGLEAQNAELVGQISNSEEEVVDENNLNVDASNYVYVGDWGVKIKVPEELKYISYSFKYGDGLPDGTISSGLSIFATVGDSLSDFANMYKSSSPLGSVVRITKGAYGDGIDCQFSLLVFSDDTYNYCYSHPQSVYSTDENEQNLELQTVELIQQTLTNPDNYIKF